jgi:predicted nucleic acid-binding protein
LNYLLDTNIASYLMERRPAVVAKVGEAGGPGLLSISTISLAELTYGIRVMPQGRKRERLFESLERILETDMDVRPFSAYAARVYSEAGATLKGAGIAFEFSDLAIASIAIAKNKTLASNDAFFEQIERLHGLSFERWQP